MRALKDIGAGGFEFVPFYNYGYPTPTLNQSDRYAFGKPAFVDVFRVALEAAKENGLSMDFALGASQGQGVPVEPLTPGLAVQLVYGKMTVKGGERVQGELPAPDLDWREELGFIQPQERFGPSRLVGVSAAAVSSCKLPHQCREPAPTLCAASPGPLPLPALRRAAGADALRRLELI